MTGRLQRPIKGRAVTDQGQEILDRLAAIEPSEGQLDSEVFLDPMFDRTHAERVEPQPRKRRFRTEILVRNSCLR